MGGRGGGEEEMGAKVARFRELVWVRNDKKKNKVSGRAINQLVD